MDFNHEAYRDWMQQAQNTLSSAEVDASHEFFNWACFKSQQATEYGLKAVLYGLGLPAFGHSVVQLAAVVAESLRDLELDETCLATLDKMYIPTRYADAFPSGSPYRFYSTENAREAISCAELILGLLAEWSESRESTKTGEEKKIEADEGEASH